MTNEQAKADLAAIIDGVQEQMRTIAHVQRQRAELTGTATVRGKRVTVTVNADNVVIETKLSADVEDLTYPEIAKAVTEAAQQASAEVARKTQALMAPLQTQRSRLPKLSDLVEGMPELAMPQPVEASTASPSERQHAGAQQDSPMRFNNVENVPQHGRGSAVTDQSW